MGHIIQFSSEKYLELGYFF